MTIYNGTIGKKSRLHLFEWDENSRIPGGGITYILAFTIPLIIFIAIYIARGIYPFGNNCFLRTDMYHQYAPFFAEFNNKLSEHTSLAYSWNIGMGTNFTALYAYYLASPMNWIVFLFPTSITIELMNVLIILKLCLASVTLTHYLAKKFNSRPCTIAVFGTFYALSGYVAAYNWNIMWLDCIWLLPLIILGIERLVKENKCFLYCITLGLCIFTNYYISIMVCIVCVIYFIVTIFSYGCNDGIRGILKKSVNFGLFSLLAGGLAACMLLPEIQALSLTASSSINFPEKLTEYFPIMQMLVRQLANVPVHMGLEHHPNIYCGIITIMLVVLFATNKRIRISEKIGKFAILLILLISFNLNIPDFIWHGFHFPNSLPCRQSFIYIFFLLVIAYEAFRDMDYYKSRQISLAFWIPFAFVIIGDQFLTNSTYTFSLFYINGAFILVYGLLMILYNKRKLPGGVALFLFFAVTISECTMNMSLTGISTTSRVAYVEDNAAIRTVLDEVAAGDDSFYRVEKIFGRKTKNDGAWLNYKSISSFSSMANCGIVKLYQTLGLQSSTNAYCSNGGTLVSYSLFGVKYLLSNQSLATSPMFTFAGNCDNISIYENKFVLPLGYAVPANLDEEWSNITSNGITSQNKLIKLITGIDNVFEQTGIRINDSYYYLVPERSGHMYGIIYSGSPESVTVTYNGLQSQYYPDLHNNYIIDFGYVTENDNLVISANSTINMDVYMLDEAAFTQAHNIMVKSGFNMTEFNDTHIEGTVTLESASDFLFSIPYDPNWVIKVDGKKVDTKDFRKALLLISLDAGTHTITLDYKQAAFSTGLLITIASALILLCIYLFKRLNLAQAIRKYIKSSTPKLLDEIEE